MKLATWQNELQSLFHKTEDLLNYLEITPSPEELSVSPSFALRVPLSFASRMKKGNRSDPLLRQVLPCLSEFSHETSTSLSLDPLKESEFIYSPGVLQKFQGRILIVSTGYCPVHCRYCFRRHFDYTEQQISLKDWDLTLETIRKDTSISEVIFSGGDPLTLPDRKLQTLFQDLKTIPHLRSIRIHTRFPIVIPSRLTPELKSLLRDDPCSLVRIVTVLHINHAQELDHALSQTLRQWNAEGVLLMIKLFYSKV